MKRSIEKALADYDKLVKAGTTTGNFYITDLEQIKALAGNDVALDVSKAILIALKSGYAIGYRTAQRHAK